MSGSGPRNVHLVSGLIHSVSGPCHLFRFASACSPKGSNPNVGTPTSRNCCRSSNSDACLNARGQNMISVPELLSCAGTRPQSLAIAPSALAFSYGASPAVIVWATDLSWIHLRNPALQNSLARSVYTRWTGMFIARILP